MNRFFSVIVVALCSLLLAGCSKSGGSAGGPAQTVDLGTVNITPGTDFSHELEGGRTVVIKAEQLSVVGLSITANLEKGGKVLETATAVPVTPDAPYILAVGSTTLKFTPHVNK